MACFGCERLFIMIRIFFDGITKRAKLFSFHDVKPDSIRNSRSLAPLIFAEINFISPLLFQIERSGGEVVKRLIKPSR